MYCIGHRFCSKCSQCVPTHPHTHFLASVKNADPQTSDAPALVTGLSSDQRVNQDRKWKLEEPDLTHFLFSTHSHKLALS